MSIHCNQATRIQDKDRNPIICKQDGQPCGYQFFCGITEQMEQKRDATECVLNREAKK